MSSQSALSVSSETDTRRVLVWGALEEMFPTLHHASQRNTERQWTFLPRSGLQQETLQYYLSQQSMGSVQLLPTVLVYSPHAAPLEPDSLRSLLRHNGPFDDLLLLPTHIAPEAPLQTLETPVLHAYMRQLEAMLYLMQSFVRQPCKKPPQRILVWLQYDIDHAPQAPIGHLAAQWSYALCRQFAAELHGPQQSLLLALSSDAPAEHDVYELLAEYDQDPALYHSQVLVRQHNTWEPLPIAHTPFSWPANIITFSSASYPELSPDARSASMELDTWSADNELGTEEDGASTTSSSSSFRAAYDPGTPPQAPTPAPSSSVNLSLSADAELNTEDEFPTEFGLDANRFHPPPRAENSNSLSTPSQQLADVGAELLVDMEPRLSLNEQLYDDENFPASPSSAKCIALKPNARQESQRLDDLAHLSAFPPHARTIESVAPEQATTSPSTVAMDVSVLSEVQPETLDQTQDRSTSQPTAPSQHTAPSKDEVPFRAHLDNKEPLALQRSYASLETERASHNNDNFEASSSFDALPTPPASARAVPPRQEETHASASLDDLLAEIDKTVHAPQEELDGTSQPRSADPFGLDELMADIDSIAPSPQAKAASNALFHHVTPDGDDFGLDALLADIDRTVKTDSESSDMLRKESSDLAPSDTEDPESIEDPLIPDINEVSLTADVPYTDTSSYVSQTSLSPGDSASHSRDSQESAGPALHASFRTEREEEAAHDLVPDARTTPETVAVSHDELSKSTPPRQEHDSTDNQEPPAYDPKSIDAALREADSQASLDNLAMPDAIELTTKEIVQQLSLSTSTLESALIQLFRDIDSLNMLQRSLTKRRLAKATGMRPQEWLTHIRRHVMAWEHLALLDASTREFEIQLERLLIRDFDPTPLQNLLYYLDAPIRGLRTKGEDHTQQATKHRQLIQRHLRLHLHFREALASRLEDEEAL